MSKSDAKITNIDLEQAFKTAHLPSWKGDKQINAFDTETFEGTVFMLSYAIGDNYGSVDNNYISQLSSKEIFEKLTDYKCRSQINVWYNLDFDANALLSGILDNKQLTELSVSNQTHATVDGIEYDISYVKGKFLIIQDMHNNKYPHYDISQFFYTSLDNASKEWLGKEKKNDIDASKFGSKPCENHDKVNENCNYCWTLKNAASYIMERYDSVRKYAVKDAKLTQELAYQFIQEAEKLNIPCGMPFSTGYLSAEYMRANMDSKVNFGSSSYQSLFWDSYYGGRFEVFERGNVGQVVAPDINSAYPAIMQNLPDPSTLDWQYYQNEISDTSFTYSDINLEDIIESDYGVIRVRLTTNPNKKIQPFAYKIDGKVHFPALTDTIITVITPIFEFAVKNDYVLDYKILEGWLATEKEYTEYPYSFIGDMYGERKLNEKKLGKPKKGQLLKIVLNSSYGKTCQTTENYRIVEVGENEEIELAENESIQPKEFLSLGMRNNLSDNEVIIRELNAGKRFNPFLASYITGLTRLELHKQVEKYGLVEDTVMFATDCIMVKKDAYENSNFEDIIQVPDTDLEGNEFKQQAKKSLGLWDFDYEGKAFVVGSGVYEVEFENGETYTKTRGFTQKDLGKNLKQLAKENPEGIEIQNVRPLTIPEVLISPDKGNVSQFVKQRKKIRPDFDTKRNWPNNPTFADLLEDSEISTPIDIADRQAELLKEIQERNVENERLNVQVDKGES